MSLPESVPATQDGALFINGRFGPAASGATYQVIDPSTEEAIRAVADAGPEDVERAVAAARSAFDGGAWPAMTAAGRGRLLARLADLIERETDSLIALECRNSGMPPAFARAASVSRSVSFLRFFASTADKLLGETIPVDAPGQFAMTVREPIGVVGGIISWNVPLINAVGKLAPALAAGCTLVLKASEQTPLTALRLAELVAEAGFPDGVFNLLTGRGGNVARALVAHPLVDKIAFTGSTVVGKQVMAAASATLKRVSLELGGKSPVIVLPDADLAKASATAAMGIFANAGQVCIAGSRLYVHRSVADEVVAAIVERARTLRVGPGLAEGTEMGPLISAVQRERVLEYVSGSAGEGMNTLVGGNRLPGRGFFMEPTVLEGEVRSARVLDEEIFGPVLCVTRFDDDDLSAIAALVNRTRYGLSANIWTRNLSSALTLAGKIQSGSVRINGGVGYDPAVPFGGYKESGIGRENGTQGTLAYTELKAITVAL